MPAPLVGRKFGVHVIPVPNRSTCEQIQVLGISGSSRQQPGMSKSEKLLLFALERFAKFGCQTRFLRLKDLKIYDCERELFRESGLLYLSLPELDEV